MVAEGKIIHTAKAIITLSADGIISQDYRNNIDLTIEDSLSEMGAYKELCQGKKRPVSINIQNIKTVQRESRQFYSGEEPARYVAVAALIIGNPVSRIMANFFMGINKTFMPVKLFTDQEEAVKWLSDYL